MIEDREDNLSRADRIAQSLQNVLVLVLLVAMAFLLRAVIDAGLGAHDDIAAEQHADAAAWTKADKEELRIEDALRSRPGKQR